VSRRGFRFKRHVSYNNVIFFSEYVLNLLIFCFYGGLAVNRQEQ